MDGDTRMVSSENTYGSSGITPASQGFWAPNTQNYVAGSAPDLKQNLKLAGIKLRRELLLNAHNDLDSWSLLMSPPSIYEAFHTLVEMLLNIPAEDRDHFTRLVEASVCMPLRILEKYFYLTIKLMQHLQEQSGNAVNNLPE